MFGATSLPSEEIRGKDILEVGSHNVNGSLEPFLSSHKPNSYLGVDIEIGPGVDKICRVENLVEQFGKNSFDVVIATELMEHVRPWRVAISNMKQVCRPGGSILITTRSRGFRYHGYPNDYWRYETADFEKIFSDFEIQALQQDPMKPGVFIKAVKPSNFSERDLADINLYSIILRKRVSDVKDSDLKSFRFKYNSRTKAIWYFNKTAGKILKPWT